MSLLWNKDKSKISKPSHLYQYTYTLWRELLTRSVNFQLTTFVNRRKGIGNIKWIIQKSLRYKFGMHSDV